MEREATRRWRAQPRAVTSELRAVWGHPANRGVRLLQVIRLLRFHVRGRLHGRATIVPLGSHSRIWARPQTLSARVAHGNPPDWAEMLAWRQLLRPGDLFVDIGAHVGTYTVWALDLGARVVAVEPIEPIVDELRANLALNGYDAEVVQAAVADRPGVMAMAGVDAPRKHLLVAAEPAATDAPATSQVTVTTLDDVLGDRTAAGVKIDVEGAEALVLAGATRALGERRIRALQLEWNDCSVALLGQNREPVAQALRAAGYELFRPDGEGRLQPLRSTEFGGDVFALAPA